MRRRQARPSTKARRSRAPRAAVPAARAAVDWLALTALYLALAGSLQPAELAAAGASAAVSFLFLDLLRRQGSQHYRGRLVWLRELPRVAMRFCTGTAAVAAVILRAIATAGRDLPDGRQVELPFAPGSDAHTAMRRAFATLTLCITPDTYMLFDDRRRHRLLVRAVLPRRAPSARTGADVWPA